MNPAADQPSFLRRLRSRPKPVISSRTPRIDPPHRFVAADRVLYNQLTNALTDAAASHASGRLIDIGCGTKPWEPLFARHVSEHIGVDLESSGGPHTDRIDIFGSAYSVPLESESADTVLLTEVLEHLADPLRALEEAHRLLRRGGAVILTTPLLFPIHAPDDYFRYAPRGLEHLLRAAGFTDIAVRPLSGQWTTLSMLRGIALNPYRRGPLLQALIDAYCTVSLALAVRLDEADFRANYSWNHVATARKPE